MKYTMAAVILIMTLLSSCSPKRTTEVKALAEQNVFNNPHFYYDEENYTLIRVNPETRLSDINEYLNRTGKFFSGPFQQDSLPDYEPPWPIKLVKPHYPNEAKEKGIEGTAFLQLLLDTLGNVKIATALGFFSDERINEIKKSNESLMEFLRTSAAERREFNYFEELLIMSALQSAIHTKFRPARLSSGAPIELWISFPVKYVLG